MSNQENNPPSAGASLGNSWTFGAGASLAALVLGLGLGVLSHATGASGLQLLNSLFEPLGYLWLNALQMTVLPLVVANLIVAIVNAGSSREVGWLGGTSVALFVLFLLSVGAITALVTSPIIAQLPVDAGSLSALSNLSEQAKEVIS